MAKPKNPNRIKAFEMYKEHGGNITNRAIAKKLDVPEKTISVWKYRDKWKDKIGGEIRSTSKRSSTSNNKREKQKEQVINALKVANSYSPALDILIELYLDCYEEYERAKEKNLETEKLRKELARLIDQLGLNINNRNMFKKQKKEEEKEELPQTNKLLMFRQRMSK